MTYIRKGDPTKTWKPRHAQGVPRAVAAQFDELGERLSRPEFYNGIWVGDGDAPTVNPDTGERVIPELKHITAASLRRLEDIDVSTLPKGIVAMATSTQEMTVEEDLAIVSVAATLSAGRYYKLSGAVWNVVQLDSNALWSMRIRNGSTNRTLTAVAHRAPEWGSTPWAVIEGNGEQHVYTLTIQRETGTVGALVKAHATAPHRILIEDIGAVT